MTALTTLARNCVAAAVEAVQPQQLLRQLAFTPRGVRFKDASLEPEGRLFLASIGKAGTSMALAFLKFSRRVPEELFVLAPQGVAVPSKLAAVTHLGTHPRASQANARAATVLLHQLARLGPTDGVVLLLSGGGSALLSLPVEGVSVEEVDQLAQELSRRGANIRQLNTVRKHLSQTLGGQLAARCPAPLLALVLSDVPGDDLTVVASGPTVGDPSTVEDALGVLRRFGLAEKFPRLVQLWRKGVGETPKPEDGALGRARTFLLASNRDALERAKYELLAAGFRPQVLTTQLRGEAREVGRALGAALASATPGTALLAAGETTVTVRGQGRGGRNLELALAAALRLADVPHRCLLAASTDGLDGTSPAAGAVVDGQTLFRARQAGKDAQQALEQNDSWGFFDGLPEAIITGPTGTNVADIVLALAAPEPALHLPPRAKAWQRPSPPAGGWPPSAGGGS